MKYFAILAINLAICLSSIEAGFLNFNHFRRLNWIEFKDKKLHSGDSTRLNICWNRRAPPDETFDDEHKLWLFGAGKPINIEFAKDVFTSSDKKRTGFWGQRRQCHGIIFRFPDIDSGFRTSKLYFRLQNVITKKFLTKSPKFTLTIPTQHVANKLDRYFGFNLTTGTRVSNYEATAEQIIHIQSLLKDLDRSNEVYLECSKYKSGFYALDDKRQTGRVTNDRWLKDQTRYLSFPNQDMQKVIKFPREVNNRIELSKKLKALKILHREPELCFASKSEMGIKVPILAYKTDIALDNEDYLKVLLTVSPAATQKLSIRTLEIIATPLLGEIIHMYRAGVVFRKANSVAHRLLRRPPYEYFVRPVFMPFHEKGGHYRLFFEQKDELNVAHLSTKSEIHENDLKQIFTHMFRLMTGDRADKTDLNDYIEKVYNIAKEKFLALNLPFKILY